MKRRLLDLIVCMKCRGTFTVEPFQEETGSDIVEGALCCEKCGATFPIIEGVPRLLNPALLALMQPRYLGFFARHPEFLPRATNGLSGDSLADTLESFTRQRLDLCPPGPEFVSQWREHLRRNLGGAVTLATLRDKLILDVGCGFGRHLYIANEAGAETVGVDLSGGIDVARQNNLGYPRCHLVQANILDRPFREDCFDVVWSLGVLHHLPDPRTGFATIVPFARRDGGVVIIWVYGYRGMAFTYRLSHMRLLHRVTHKMSSAMRVYVSKAVAALLSGLYWEPLRIAKRIGFGRVVERLPLTEHIEQGWIARVAAVHDRLSTPITHFHDRDELVEWFHMAGLIDVVVEDTNRRGWRAHGSRLDRVDALKKHAAS